VTLLTFDKVTVVGAAGRARLSEFDLRIERSECVFVLGPNGAGKSTLLRTALGLERVATGSVQLEAEPVRALGPRERARRVAWLPQDQYFEASLLAWEVVASARYRFFESQKVSRRHAFDALRRVGAEALGMRIGRELSGGEQQRVKLACLLAQDSPLLLLDEPGNHINLVSLVGPREKIRVVGLDAGRLVFDTRLSDPDLASDLSCLFGTQFRHTLVEDDRGAKRSLYHAVPGVPRDESAPS
jgi:iron complex transport system ATP-binding protein